MTHAVPAYVAKQYKGGARAFRAEKRRQLAEIDALIGAFRSGCAFFPNDGPALMDRLEAVLDEIGVALSREVWGQ